MLALSSSNPALARFEANPVVSRQETATVGGIANKTAIAVSIALVGGLAGAGLVSAFPGIMWVLLIGSGILSLGLSIAVCTNPLRASWATPIFSLAEGATLGALAFVLQSILTGMGVTTMVNIGVQALLITISVAVAMLVIYRMGLIRANKTFVAVLFTLTLGIGLAYLANFILGLFGTQIPFLGLSSALEGGKAAWWGLGINVFILIVASLWLVVDFQRIEEATAGGAPRFYEWYFAFALMVTLVWIYIEALKLAFRVAAANRR